MIRILTVVIVLLVLFSAAPVRAQEAKNQEDSPLNRLVGTWSKTIVIHPSAWIPNRQEKTGEHTTKWILNNYHLMEEGLDSDGQEYKTVYTYDAVNDEFGYVMFQSNDGSPQAFKGKWDADREAFVFQSSIAEGVKMTITYDFEGPDQFDLTVLAKDSSDQVLFNLTAVGKRVSRRR